MRLEKLMNAFLKIGDNRVHYRSSNMHKQICNGNLKFSIGTIKHVHKY